ncbi:MAG TPA: putative Ig domain-containing protein [Candidatus Acidoferrales bacterium]|nr:putative Ig domain-containing protein [Candidatus Acidoferrales bacterium]
MQNSSQTLARQLFASFAFLLIGLMLLQGCGSSPAGDPKPTPLVISTTSLPSGQVGAAYNTTLAATGGTAPLNWTTTGGTLPAGLTLNASTGAITGTPTATANNLALTFQVNDSGSPTQSKTVNLTLTIAPAAFSISTTSLPSGQVGIAYSATLGASGGMTPYTWTLTAGTLPANLALNASTGLISGTPTVSVSNTPLTFQVKDSSSPAQTKSVNLTLAIGPAPRISVSISPRRGAVATNQLLALTATVTGDIASAGVSWAVSTGGLLSGQSTSKASFSSATAGAYTVTATSNTDGSKSASVTIGVTDLSGVTTYHNNLSRDGTNTQEYALTTANVTTNSFGKLFSCPVDGAVYAQPLWVANLNINGGTHNVVFVATTHDSVYAFDADIGPCVTYWQKPLLGVGETFVDYNDVLSADIQPDIGITGTPIIDLSTKTLYVVTKSKSTGTSCMPSASCHQWLHGLSLTDGSEKFGGPATIDASITVPGTGDGSSGGVLAFNTLTESQRPGLALVNGVVYISWASHGDNDPYHGWVIGFNAGNLAIPPAAVWNSTPNQVAGSPSRGGIWMSGGAPAADSSNNLYFLTGNGSFDADSGGSNYGDSTVKLSTASGLTVAGYFTPSDQLNLNFNDSDHGAGGAAILIDQPSGPVPHLLIGGGKNGALYLVNRDNLGGFDPTTNHVVQVLTIESIFATSAFWNNSLFIAGKGGALKQFTFDPTGGLFGISPAHSSPGSFGFPGATPSVSSNGSSTNGIVWALDNTNYCTLQSPGCGPTVLHAYDATNVSTELWNSSQAGGNRDQAGIAVKFTVPTVANGKVYVGTRGNNTGGASNTSSVPGELDVYGLLP